MNDFDVTREEQLYAAANEVFRQLAENPELEIALDPDLAEFIGAFEEKALSDEERGF